MVVVVKKSLLSSLCEAQEAEELRRWPWDCGAFFHLLCEFSSFTLCVVYQTETTLIEMAGSPVVRTRQIC